MARITIGGTHDRATSNTRVSLSAASEMELSIGDAYDMSDRQTEIFERDAPALNSNITQLRTYASDIENSVSGGGLLAAEARKIAEQAEAVGATKKWQSISLSNLVALAKSVGEAALPLVDTATKVVALLKAVHGF